jgi:hypothetical protein
VRIRRPSGPNASPLPSLYENHDEQTHTSITSVRGGGDR